MSTCPFIFITLLLYAALVFTTSPILSYATSGTDVGIGADVEKVIGAGVGADTGVTAAVRIGVLVGGMIGVDAGEAGISETFVDSSFSMHPANTTVDAISRVVKTDTSSSLMVILLKIFIA